MLASGHDILRVFVLRPDNHVWNVKRIWHHHYQWDRHRRRLNFYLRCPAESSDSLHRIAELHGARYLLQRFAV